MKKSRSPKKGKKDRGDLLTVIATAINKKFGSGTAARMSDDGAVPDVKYIVPTGLASLDAAFGVGGVPLGKIIEISGPESSGKSTLCMWLAIQCQKVGVKVIYFDGESSSDLQWDVALGLDPDNVLISKPYTLPEMFGALNIFSHSIVENGEFGLAIVDSITSFKCIPKEDDFAQIRGYPLEAAYLSANLPKLRHFFDTGSVGYLFINQVRTNVGGGPYDPKTITPLGYALKHWCHVRGQISRAGWIKAGGKDSPRIGVRSRIKMGKNKVAEPLKEAIFSIYWDPPRLIGDDAPELYDE